MKKLCEDLTLFSTTTNIQQMNVLKSLNLERLCLISFLFTVLVSRLYFASPWLEDWDSVQFALGIHHFSVVNHQPHPPGYPLYILLARFFYLFFNDDLKSLSFLSSLSGSLIILPIFYLAKKMFNPQAAIFSILISIFIPVVWIMSEIPVSNIPGLFFITLLGYFFYSHQNNASKLTLLCFLLGLVLGVRFTDFPIACGLVLFSILRIRSLKWGSLFLSLFSLGILVWLLPTILLTGFREYFKALSLTSNYVLNHDIGGNYLNSLLSFIHLRLFRLKLNLITSLTLSFLLFSVVVLYPFLNVKRIWSKPEYQFLFLWIISYSLPLAFFFNQELPQYVLPLTIPLSILISSFFEKALYFKRLGKLTYLLVLVLLINLLLVSLPQLWFQKNQIPVTVKPVLYVKSSLNPSQTTLITTYIYRQFQYYAPEFKNYYGTSNLPQEINSEFVGLDYLPIKDQVPSLKGYQVIDSMEYSELEQIIPRIKDQRFYILKRLNHNKDL